MYCRKCYADLGDGTALECPRCGTPFNPRMPATFLRRPFPDAWSIFFQIVGTTALGIVVAFVVAFHQMARASGH